MPEWSEARMRPMASILNYTLVPMALGLADCTAWSKPHRLQAYINVKAALRASMPTAIRKRASIKSWSLACARTGRNPASLERVLT